MKELMTMSEKEMVAMWRQMMNLDVPRSDCQVERADGIDLDALLLTNVRLWYEHQLLTASPGAEPVVQRALAVVRPAAGQIVIGRDALSTMPRFDDLVR